MIQTATYLDLVLDGRNQWLDNLPYYNTDDIIEFVRRADQLAPEYTVYLAERLANECSTIEELCYMLHHMVYHGIKYQEDPIGAQYVKSPGMLVSDKEGDCKSFSVFIGSVLKNLDIAYDYKFISQKPGKPVHHVYVVAYDEQKQPIYVDACSGSHLRP